MRGTDLRSSDVRASELARNSITPRVCNDLLARVEERRSDPQTGPPRHLSPGGVRHRRLGLPRRSQYPLCAIDASLRYRSSMQRSSVEVGGDWASRGSPHVSSFFAELIAAASWASQRLSPFSCAIGGVDDEPNPLSHGRLPEGEGVCGITVVRLNNDVCVGPDLVAAWIEYAIALFAAARPSPGAIAPPSPGGRGSLMMTT